MPIFGKRRKPNRKQLLLERLEDRVLLSADPVAAVATPGESLINEDFGFTVSFDNAGAEEIVVGLSPGFVADPNSNEKLLPIPHRVAMTPGGAKRLITALSSALKGLEDAKRKPEAPREAELPKLVS